jgi:hypothetical protein
VDNAGATRTDVTITGGTSNSFETWTCDTGDVVADSATDTVVLAGGQGIVTTGTGGPPDTVTIDADIDTGTGLEFVSNKIAIKAGTYIDVGAGGVSVDLTEVASYSGAATQVLQNATGTIQWVASSSVGATYSAGTYLDLSGTTFDVDLTEAANYSGADRQFFWHESGVINWETITGYASSFQVLCKKADNTWHLLSVVDVLKELTGYTLANAQSIGKDAADTPEWQDDTVCA